MRTPFTRAPCCKRCPAVKRRLCITTTRRKLWEFLVSRLRREQWFGFVEVDIEVPRELWEKFEEFPPLFLHRSIGPDAIPQHMRDYLTGSGRTFTHDQKKLLGFLSEEKMLLYAPLLEWYLDQGLVVTAVYRTIGLWFVHEVANKRRQGDADGDKALLAEEFKLLGNSAYGKFIEPVERQTRVVYTTDKETVDKHLRSVWFEVLEEIGGCYKIECRKNKVTVSRPFQIGIVVYQLAKLRMLQFYYDFLDYYVDRRDFELIQMDTDSLYFALSYDMLEEAVIPERLKEFELEKKDWLSWDKWSSREPGLFKNEDSGKAKVSSKGMSKTQNKLKADMAAL